MLRGWQAERDALLRRCVAVLDASATDGGDLEMRHVETVRRVRAYDETVLQRYGDLMATQSGALVAAGCTLIRPPPLTDKDIRHNKRVLWVLLINHT